MLKSDGINWLAVINLTVSTGSPLFFERLSRFPLYQTVTVSIVKPLFECLSSFPVYQNDSINLLVAVWTSVLFSFVLDSSSINWQSAIFERLSRFPWYETVTLSINWQTVK